MITEKLFSLVYLSSIEHAVLRETFNQHAPLNVITPLIQLKHLKYLKLIG